MSSKLKLDYQFNTAANLEIEYAAGRWVRTTANWFRAFIGPRRIDGQLYVGPIYYEGTNVIYKPLDQEHARIVSISELSNTKLRARLTPKSVKLKYPNKRQRAV